MWFHRLIIHSVCRRRVARSPYAWIPCACAFPHPPSRRVEHRLQACVPPFVSSAHYAFHCQRSHFDCAFECPAFCRRVPTTRHMPHLLACSASHASLRLIIAHLLPRSLARTSRLRRWRPCRERVALVIVLPARRYTHPVSAAAARYAHPGFDHQLRQGDHISHAVALQLLKPACTPLVWGRADALVMCGPPRTHIRG